jgi:hypothetical protein
MESAAFRSASQQQQKTAKGRFVCLLRSCQRRNQIRSMENAGEDFACSSGALVPKRKWLPFPTKEKALLAATERVAALPRHARGEQDSSALRSTAERSARIQPFGGALKAGDPERGLVSWQEGMPATAAQAFAEQREAQSGATSTQSETTRARRTWDSGAPVPRKRYMDLTLRRVGARVNWDARRGCDAAGRGWRCAELSF